LSIAQPRHICVLPQELKTRIAAGEVVEGAYSVVKELVENSIDSGADEILIEIENGGLAKIRVHDNGSGMYPEDLPISILEHATSKIQNASDLSAIQTLGFRGEALSSITSISHFQIRTRCIGCQDGVVIRGSQGEIEETFPFAMEQGTDILIENLFFNTPARRKFQKSPSAQLRQIKELIYRIALAFPQKRWELVADGKKIITLFKQQNLLDRIEEIYGGAFREAMISVEILFSAGQLTGYISTPSFHKSTRQQQILFVNNRVVELANYSFFLSKAYEGFLEKGTYPVAILFLDLNPQDIDVNVHPTKREIRFHDPKAIHSILINGLAHTLQKHDFANLIPGAQSGMVHLPGNQFNMISSQKSDYSGDVAETEEIQIFNYHTETLSQSIVPVSESIYNSILKWKFLAVFQHTYLLFEGVFPGEYGNSLILIDFHAAHERIWYERFLGMNWEPALPEKLLFPYVIEWTPDELDHLEELQSTWENNGILWERTGPRFMSVHALPYFLRNMEIENIFRESIDIISRQVNMQLSYMDEYYKNKSCKSAVKSGDVLKEEEISRLLLDLSQCKNPTRCPHGRPVMHGLNRNYLDQLFKRIV